MPRTETAPVLDDPQGRESITCEEFGYTPGTERVWWIPQTKEKFLLRSRGFQPYDGPVIHGTGYSW